MLAHLLAAFVVAAFGGPNAPAPDELCLMKSRCDREPVYCLVDDAECERWRDGRACFVAACEPDRRLQP